MLRRQYKILLFVTIIILLIVLLKFHERYDAVAENIKWKLNNYLTTENFSELETFSLPNFKEEAINNEYKVKAWYTTWGEGMPRPSQSSEAASSLFPDPRKPYDDRITQQLMYVPPHYSSETEHKLVLLHDYLGSWISHEEGPKAFEGCPVDKCLLTTNRGRIGDADAVLFDNTFAAPSEPKRNGQVWIIYMLESPLHTREMHPADLFNWTITYRPDSDLSAPYGKWIYHGPSHRKSRPLRNYALNKTKRVAWFASNCHAKNKRLEYTTELQKYIDVDIFGYCGEAKCPRSNEELCYKLLTKRYKFYLAFENSNCNYYITEKFFKNALRHNIIPIVMGGRRADYEHAAPAGSFIHFDDFSSPKQLASYLHKLDRDDELYNEYFLWRGTGEFIQDRLFCRICAMLHSKHPDKHYKDINRWWRGNHACSTDY